MASSKRAASKGPRTPSAASPTNLLDELDKHVEASLGSEADELFSTSGSGGLDSPSPSQIPVVLPVLPLDLRASSAARLGASSGTRGSSTPPAAAVVVPASEARTWSAGHTHFKDMLSAIECPARRAYLSSWSEYNGRRRGATSDFEAECRYRLTSGNRETYRWYVAVEDAHLVMPNWGKTPEVVPDKSKIQTAGRVRGVSGMILRLVKFASDDDDDIAEEKKDWKGVKAADVKGWVLKIELTITSTKCNDTCRQGSSKGSLCKFREGATASEGGTGTDGGADGRSDGAAAGAGSSSPSQTPRRSGSRASSSPGTPVSELKSGMGGASPASAASGDSPARDRRWESGSEKFADMLGDIKCTARRDYLKSWMELKGRRSADDCKWRILGGHHVFRWQVAAEDAHQVMPQWKKKPGKLPAKAAIEDAASNRGVRDMILKLVKCASGDDDAIEQEKKRWKGIDVGDVAGWVLKIELTIKSDKCNHTCNQGKQSGGCEFADSK